jgi:hypothetical protein
MLRNHIRAIPESPAADAKMAEPITRKMLWDWVGIIRWALPGIVVAGLWVWNTSATNAAREQKEAAQHAALVMKQEELEKSVDNFITLMDKASESMAKAVILIEVHAVTLGAHEKRLDRLEER